MKTRFSLQQGLKLTGWPREIAKTDGLKPITPWNTTGLKSPGGGCCVAGEACCTNPISNAAVRTCMDLRTSAVVVVAAALMKSAAVMVPRATSAARHRQRHRTPTAALGASRSKKYCSEAGLECCGTGCCPVGLQMCAAPSLTGASSVRGRPQQHVAVATAGAAPMKR